VPGEVRIVLVEANFVTGRQLLISAPCAFCENALAGFVLSYYLAKRCALWRGIFRVRVIVVEPGAIYGKNKVAFYFLKTGGRRLSIS
jgi:hypothetical protein